jgi:hypothetical protein
MVSFIINEPQMLDSTNPRDSQDDHTSGDDDIKPMRESQPNSQMAKGHDVWVGTPTRA